MQSGRFAIGILAGVLLALGVVASSSFTFGLPGFASAPIGQDVRQTVETMTSTTSSSTPPVLAGELNTTKASTNSSTSAPGAYAASYTSGAASSPLSSHLDAIARQPIALTGFVLLPVFAAFMFGLALYAASRVRRKPRSPEESEN